MNSSPRRTMSPSSSSSSFQHFQRSVDDAWDAGDDDQFCIVSTASSADSHVHISSSLANRTALSVINSHKMATAAGGHLSDHNIPANNTLTAVHSGFGDVNRSSNNGAASNINPGRRHFVSETGKAGAMQRLAVQCVAGETGRLPPSSPSSPSITPTAVRQSSVPLPPPVRYHKHKANTGLCQEAGRLAKLQEAVSAESTSLSALRALCWGGVPQPVRALCWRLLSGYIPLVSSRRTPTLERRRLEYWGFVNSYYESRQQDLHQDTYRQIHIDIPRMSPLIPLFQQRCVQEMFERILFIWAIRHPASGYVQGMNDLVTPYFIVFLQEVLPPEADVDQFELSELSEQHLRAIEADTFWSMSRLLEGIQDNYTFAQPGIQKKVTALAELVQRIDAPLHNHIVSHGIDYLQFAFRWMNNLLMRELPLHCTIRLWDTYLSEEDGFANFHLYVCTAFLIYWSKQLLAERDFQGLMLTLQNLPTHEWTNREVSVLVAEAYRLKFTYADAPGHLVAIRGK